MSFRINITPDTIWRLIAKKVLQAGALELRLEVDSSTGQWAVVKSGWQPLNDFKADNPATLLRAIAMVLDHRAGVELEHKSSESPTDEGRLLK